MFAGFNLMINEIFFDSQKKSFQEYQKIGEKHLILCKSSNGSKE